MNDANWHKEQIDNQDAKMPGAMLAVMSPHKLKGFKVSTMYMNPDYSSNDIEDILS